MVDLLDDTSTLADARDMARLLVALFAESVGARQVSVQVRIPDPDRFATLGVLGHQHFASTLLTPAGLPGLVPLLHSAEPLWARTRHESHETMRKLLGESTDRIPDLEDCPPQLLATALRTPERVLGWVMLGSGPDGFRLADLSLTSLLARCAGHVLDRATTATVFDGSGRITSHALVPAKAVDHPTTAGAPAVAPPRGELPSDDRLTARQLEVLVEIADGATNPQIAAHLGLSVHTVRTHRRHLMEHFEAHTSTALIARARSAGTLTD
jgi:DNA-binding CsgD family transcriptional regulator